MEIFKFVSIRPPEKTTTHAITLPKHSFSSQTLQTVEEAFIKGDDLKENTIVQEFGAEKTLSAAIAQSNNIALINKLSIIVADQMDINIREDGLQIENLLDILEQSPSSPRTSYLGPVGVGDLTVVEEHLLGYELGEISHIENVMGKEQRSRNHKINSLTETVRTDETEIATFNEENLHSTERFELQTSAQTEIQKRSALQSGLEISGSYGPTIEAKATLDFSLENSKNEGRQRSSQFAQEIVQESINRTEERIKSTRQTRRVTQVEESNSHGFDNTQNIEHITGVYRFVNKKLRMKVVEKGKRFFFEFIVPDPGAYLREVMEAPTNARVPKPKMPTESIQSITPNTYKTIIKKYGLIGIAPPPSGDITLTETFGDGDTGKTGSQRFRKEGAIQIDDGYMADHASVLVTTFKQHTTDPEVWVTLGETLKRRSNGWPGINDGPIQPIPLGRFDLQEQRRSLGYQVYCRHDSTVQISIEVVCKPTPEALLKWQHSVYDAIQDKYQESLSEWKNTQESIQLDESFGIENPFPPDVLRKTETNELKRLCLQMLGQKAAQADPLNEGDTPLVVERGEAPLEEGNVPIQLDKLDYLAPEIRFGEQAFEWENMSYVLYPYYWGQPREWTEKLKLDHPDLKHAEFLRSGAARVLVPVRESFLETLVQFLQVGRKSLASLENLKITDPLWVPLLDEIKASKNAPQQREVIECWDITLPTRLMMLDQSNELPAFEVDDDCPVDES